MSAPCRVPQRTKGKVCGVPGGTSGTWLCSTPTPACLISEAYVVPGILMARVSQVPSIEWDITQCTSQTFPAWMLCVTYPWSLLHHGCVWTVTTGTSLPSASGKDLHLRCRSVDLEVKRLPQELLKILCAFPCVTSATLPQSPCHLLCTCVCACLCLRMFMLVCMWCVYVHICVCLHMFMLLCVYSHVHVLPSVCAEGRGQPSVSPVLYHPSPCFLRQFLTEPGTQRVS